MFKIKEDFHFYWRMDVERREIGNGYVNVGHGTKVILSVSSLSLSGGQELTITTDVFSFPCYQFPFVFTHINKWIQKHTTPFFPHIISALWTSVDISNKICFTVSVELKYSHKASLCPHYGVRTLGRWGPWTMDMTMAQHNDQRAPPMRQHWHKQCNVALNLSHLGNIILCPHSAAAENWFIEIKPSSDLLTWLSHLVRLMSVLCSELMAGLHWRWGRAAHSRHCSQAEKWRPLMSLLCHWHMAWQLVLWRAFGQKKKIKSLKLYCMSMPVPLYKSKMFPENKRALCIFPSILLTRSRHINMEY